MTLNRKIKNIAKTVIANQLSNVIVRATSEQAAYCIWADNGELKYTIFRDYGWEEIGKIAESTKEITIDQHCVDSDTNNNLYLLYNTEGEVSFTKTEGRSWSAPVVMVEEGAKSFSICYDRTVLNKSFIGVIKSVSGAQDRLIFTDASKTSYYEFKLAGSQNGLIQLRQVGTKIYILWVEKENNDYESSSSSVEDQTTSGTESFSESSESSLSSISESSSSLSTSLLESYASSSSTDIGVESKIKYIVYDITNNRFDPDFLSKIFVTVVKPSAGDANIVGFVESESINLDAFSASLSADTSVVGYEADYFTVNGGISGTAVIEENSSYVNVFALSMPTNPRVFISIRKPESISANIFGIVNTTHGEGFTASLSADTPSEGYRLDYFIVGDNDLNSGVVDIGNGDDHVDVLTVLPASSKVIFAIKKPTVASPNIFGTIHSISGTGFTIDLSANTDRDGYKAYYYISNAGTKAIDNGDGEVNITGAALPLSAQPATIDFTVVKDEILSFDFNSIR
jgi:hypothetical protein